MFRLLPILVSALMMWPADGTARSLRSMSDAPPDAVQSPKRVKKNLRNKKRRRVRRIRRRRSLVRMQSGPGYRIRNPQRAWGTVGTVEQLQKVFAAYAQQFPEAEPVWFHDLSTRWGGKLGEHLSHRTGHDIDIRLVLKRYTDRYLKASPRTLHLARTWFIVKALIDSGEVELIFLDKRLQRALYRYARKQGFSREVLSQMMQIPFGNPNAVVRHWRGHRDHMHVRFIRRRPKPTAPAIAGTPLKKGCRLL